jgi:hypothetical protein
MEVTRLTDLVIVGEVFTANMILDMLAKDAFVQSGVMVPDPSLDAFLASDIGGKTISPRYLGPLAQDAANVSSDDPDVSSVPKKVSAVQNTAVVQELNQSWSEMDLAVSLNGTDPVASLQSQIGDYWRGEKQSRVLASLQGVAADNVDNDSGDMVNDITGESGASALFNATAFIDTQLTMGDRLDQLKAIAVHSTVYGTMKKLDLIDFIADSEGKATIPYYQGARVIVDDGMTVTSDSTPKYYSWLFGPGAIALGVGAPKIPFEILRTPAAGNGGGQDTVFSRVKWVIHPQGFECSLTATPTLTQLRTAGSWSRAFERKRVGVACLISNG